MNFESCVAPVSKPFFTSKYEKDQQEQDDKEKQSNCPYALNHFKIAELSLKSKLDLLQSATDQLRSFRSLTLLINKAKANADELKLTHDAVLKESPNSNSTSSVTEQYSNLMSRPEKIEHEIGSLDNDGLLSQSPARIRDDVSVRTHTTARCLTETGETILVFV